MKNVFSKLAAVVATTLMITACGGEAVDKTTEIKERGYFVVGLDDQFPPMGFRDTKTNTIVGFDIDLARATAKEMGLEVKFKPVEWDSIILSLNKGDIDVIWNGLTITPERAERIAFSPAYLANRQIVVVAEKSAIKTLADCKGKVVGVQLGSSSEKAIKKNKEFAANISKLSQFENNTLALMDLAVGRVDAVVVDEIVGRYYMSKKPGMYKVLEQGLDSEEYGIGLRQSDVGFQKLLIDAVNKVKNSSVGADISKQWFDSDILKK